MDSDKLHQWVQWLIFFSSLISTFPHWSGWNSWYNFGCNYTEQMIRETADTMIASGLASLGYQYSLSTPSLFENDLVEVLFVVNLDDCWQISRDASGRIQPDPNAFPNGLQPLIDYIHSRQLKFGLYSGRIPHLILWSMTNSWFYRCRPQDLCAPSRLVGLWEDRCRDLRWMASGFRQIWQLFWRWNHTRSALSSYAWCFESNGKIDVLFALRYGGHITRDRSKRSSLAIEWGVDSPALWAADVGNSWRTAADLQDTWKAMIGTMDIVRSRWTVHRHGNPLYF